MSYISEENIASIRKILSENSRFVVLTHVNPDGDAIGSLLALGLALDLLKKKTVLYNPSPIPAVYRFLPAVKRVVKHIRKGDDFDTAVILDCGDTERIGPGAAVLAQIPVTINVDHHITNTGFGTHQMIDTRACATSEIVYRLIKALNVTINRDIADSIYTGILTDTGSFKYSNTSDYTHKIVAELLKWKLPVHKIYRRIYEMNPAADMRLLSDLCKDFKLDGKKKIGGICRGLDQGSSPISIPNEDAKRSDRRENR